MCVGGGEAGDTVIALSGGQRKGQAGGLQNRLPLGKGTVLCVGGSGASQVRPPGVLDVFRGTEANPSVRTMHTHG